jgi:hypothetical protein
MKVETGGSMATKSSATRMKRAVKPTRTSKDSEASSKPDAEQEPNRRHRSASPLASAPSLVERVEAQRVQIMKALSIIECCKYASATLLDVDDSEYMVPAFEALHDLLNTSAEELERIAKAASSA